MAIVVGLLKFLAVGYRVVQLGLIGVAISLSIRPLRLLSRLSPNLRLRTILSLARAARKDDDEDRLDLHPKKVFKELDPEKLTIYAASLIAVVIVTPFIARLEPERSHKNLQNHAKFAAFAVVALLLLPRSVQDEIFSRGGVVVVGTMVPIYESILAVCTIDEADDVSWLQYWITSGTLSYATEFVDDMRDAFPNGGRYWYEFEFFFTLWLLLPNTDGAHVMFKCVTKPFVAPLANRVTGVFKRRGGWIKLMLLVVNASHLWIVWYAFINFPEEQRRAVVVAVGTGYPTAASIAALSMEAADSSVKGGHCTFWLTYWSSFSILFLAMDYLENFMGEIRGFYTTCLCVTVWLFLPIFNGADYVFRKVLVPLTGQYENLILRDVHRVKMEIESNMPEQHRSRLLQKAADMFRKEYAIPRSLFCKNEVLDYHAIEA
mmetsp:Transcript_57269/g.121541  ORF Transcript_57269/g.121541 Transcript_57269/m.121541 type:complete len:433 (+) Transcript_57269:62-1360(+)